MNPSPAIWQEQSVLVTGHTGFKGAWLCLWLHQLGARVSGLALDPPTNPSLYQSAGVEGLLEVDLRADIRDLGATEAAICQIRPTVIFHLAAQPLVNYGYEYPVETYAVNVMGTVHVLEAARKAGSVRAVVVVTTDKCYENHEWVYPYRETDPLGGFDPYSNSKACAELVVSAYRSSFLQFEGIAVATARAGNVIGGGDWAMGRLIPDCVRAFQSGKALRLRYPQAVRPWQHILEPLSGYLLLAERLLGDEAAEFCEAWNFGPSVADSRAVGEVARLAAEAWGGTVEIMDVAPVHHEAGLLQLDSSKTRSRLSWQPRWSVEQAIRCLIEWYQAAEQQVAMQNLSLEMIDRYVQSQREEVVR
ncbi:CDP-glucose 4,6-dehydratase [Limnothrix sp. PR1529]|uniref:CDP-glucose 4,6-dehydratase n=1 Tax=Limnothrix sp. PR1529 TaxID=1704291 RepID=UPI00081D9F98|nr:CDP-glucose 4,6-dehydratase [Limnothrix sp. PR1529]OCQ93823.1 CDP-glucose 4,6-dehydratase [Limnothrix sp. P13C2]PIB05438.1 CDP-glucose 4,6-dehydratase [Limnothrix sp. PR1529]